MEKGQRKIRFERAQRQERPHGVGVQEFDDRLRRVPGPKRIHERDVGFSLW